MPAGRTSKYGLPLPSVTIIFLLLTLPVLFSPVSAEPRNVTIDDQGGDPDTKEVPVYLPSLAWANEQCAGCRVHPDPNQLYNHTAMAATFMPDKNITNNTIDFHFTGTAVYIFFTLFSNEGEQVTVNTECNFTIDGEHVGFFNHSGDPNQNVGQGRQYGVPVFSRIGLAQMRHSMTIYMADVDYHVFLSFDYAIYTTDISNTPPQSSPTSTSINLPPPSPNSRSTATSDNSSPGIIVVTPQSSSTSVLVSTPLSPSATPTAFGSSSGVSPGIIVGGVLGGIVVLVGFLTLIYFYRRDIQRYRAPSRPEPHVPRPFIDTLTNLETGSRGRSSRRHHATHPSITSFPYSKPPALGPSGSGSRSGSGSGSDKTVEHQIRAANQRMHSLRAEMASVRGRTASSSNSSGSRADSSRMMAELAEEVKKLRQELQALKQLQRQQAQDQQPQPSFEEPPPTYHSYHWDEDAHSTR